MVRIPLIFIATATAVLAQTAPSPASLTSATTNSGSRITGQKLERDAPVITIQGVCDKAQSEADLCTTVVTKQQFETVLDVVKSISRSVVPPVPFSVAQGYSDLLVYAEAAKKAGVERDPRFRVVLEMTKVRALGDMYRRQLDEEARRVSSKEIQAFYQKNLAGFEELQLRRVTLPRNNNANLQDLAYREKAAKLAKELRERAAKGESMDVLQKEACLALAFKDDQSTLMVPLRRGMFDSKAEQAVFALKPGQVSRVLDTPGIYVFYKLESRKTLALNDVKSEISQKLYREKLEKLTKALTESVHVDYNKEYFGPAPSDNWVPASALRNSSLQTPSTR